MKLNRYTLSHPSGLLRLTAAVLICLAGLSLFAPAAFAEAHDVDNAAVSSTEATQPQVSLGEPADFVRVPAVPANVEIPEFYQEVVNVSGMYIFTLPDGTICKRIYGAIDDVYGWYEPIGPDNIVYQNSPLLDPSRDIELYRDAVNKAELEALAQQGYFGILPPDEAVTEVEQVRGIPMNDLVFVCIAGVVGLCLAITIAASSRQSRSRSGRHYR